MNHYASTQCNASSRGLAVYRVRPAFHSGRRRQILQTQNDNALERRDSLLHRDFSGKHTQILSVTSTWAFRWACNQFGSTCYYVVFSSRYLPSLLKLSSEGPLQGNHRSNTVISAFFSLTKREGRLIIYLISRFCPLSHSFVSKFYPSY